MNQSIRQLVLSFALVLIPVIASGNPVGSEKELQIVANVSGLSELTRAQLAAMFSTLSRHWPNNGPRVTVVVRRDYAEQREFGRLIGISPNTLARAWRRHVFTGSAWSPIEVDSWDEMYEAIKRMPGAIGYLPKDYVVDQVAPSDMLVIKVIKE